MLEYFVLDKIKLLFYKNNKKLHIVLLKINMTDNYLDIKVIKILNAYK